MSEPRAEAPVPDRRASDYTEYFKNRRPAAQAFPVLRWWHRRMLGHAFRFIPGLADKALLEVGVGWGLFGQECKAAGVRYLGLEMNGAQAEALRAEGLAVEQGAVPPFPAGPPVQVIWMSHVLEHAPDYRQARAMLEATWSRLEPGGYLVLLCPDLHSWGYEFWSADWSHGFPTSKRRLEELLPEVGFETITVRHHVASVAQPFLCWLLTQLFALIPHRMIDVVLEAITGRTLAHSFMTVFGWRQVLAVGRKPGGAR